MAGTMTITVRGGRSIAAGLVFLAANTAVSAAIGAAIAAVGSLLPHEVGLVVAAVVCALYLTLFIGRARVPFIPWPRQLPPTWIDRSRPRLTALRYGAVWGLTFATPVRAGSLLVLAALAVWTSSPVFGAIVFAIVGVVRSVPVAAAPFRPPDDSEINAWRRTAWPRRLAVYADVSVLTVVATFLAQGGGGV
jgi:hypothetical protein